MFDGLQFLKYEFNQSRYWTADRNTTEWNIVYPLLEL